MKRLCRRLAVAVAVLVWLGALVYLLVLSRRKLPELGTGAGAGAGGGGVAAGGGGETAYNQFFTASVKLWDLSAATRRLVSSLPRTQSVPTMTKKEIKCFIIQRRVKTGPKFDDDDIIHCSGKQVLVCRLNVFYSSPSSHTSRLMRLRN
ncbi:hypothetical protein D9C73_010418 [Collichthys lucidus]|uniref:Uncharacterized protein n=1 Tax=Collichthys lucidus TaxID=240159 RepID=A0A4U5UM66_COLLU|nr:hypothetical protein D9C73_010418 [Collichthys lucidus]